MRVADLDAHPTARTALERILDHARGGPRRRWVDAHPIGSRNP